MKHLLLLFCFALLASTHMAQGPAGVGNCVLWLKADLGHHRPSTGLRILHLISLYNPKTVNVYGFDWKKTPSFHDKKMIDERHNFALEEDYCHRRFFEKQKEVFKLKK